MLLNCCLCRLCSLESSAFTLPVYAEAYANILASQSSPSNKPQLLRTVHQGNYLVDDEALEDNYCYASDDDCVDSTIQSSSDDHSTEEFIHDSE